LRIGMLVPWRPPGGRPPTDSEIALCLPFLLRHIALVDPARLVLLGPLAARTLLPPQPRGRRPPQGWVEAAIPADARPRPVLAMAGPAMVLAKPATRRAAWIHLRMLHRALADDMPAS
ncbi:MAG: uracil-DNA glycosylase, partial [Acetobacteraceae bacterium]|nr:uracil-DNA glycosylase [Acetobacteraceae bacterium]